MPILLILAWQPSLAQPNLQWARGVGSTGDDSGYKIVVDVNGNSYTIANFTSSIDADPGSGVQTLNSAGGRDIVILKLDAAGNYQWSKRIGGNQDDRGINILLDPSGFIYVIGEFTGTVDLDPGPGVFTRSASGYTDFFILKLDLAGNFVWAVGLGGTSIDSGQHLYQDANGNIYASGFFGSTTDFDPGPANFYMNGYSSGFLLKLDGSGNFVWAKSFGDNTNVGEIVVAQNGEVFLTGIFRLTPDLDPGPSTYYLTASGWVDIFVEKLDSLGNLDWVSHVGGQNWDISNGMTSDAVGNLYVTGYFQSTVDFDPGPSTYLVAGPGSYDAFVLKLSPAGNFIWVKTWGSTQGEIGYDIELDANSDLYVVGYFEDTLDFDPGPGTFDLPCKGLADIFVQKLDTSGAFINAMGLGGTADDIGTSIQVLNNNNIFLTGYFGGTADFDPGPGISNMAAVGNRDIFIAKIGQCTPTNSTITATACNSYTAPDGQVHTNSGTYIATILNSVGCDSVITITLTINRAPLQPGAISGTNTICAGSAATFSIAPVIGATSYTWTLPSGWTGTSTSTSILVTAGTQGGTITVTADNPCGSSPLQSFPVTINTAPPQPGSINGNIQICEGSSNLYSIAMVPGATSYSWILPNGWTGSSTTNMIPTTAGSISGTITVSATNVCGTSIPQTLNVTVTPDPVANFSAATNLLVATFTDMSAGATSWVWNFGDGGASTSQNPVHTYSTAGSYMVCLTAINNGCLDTLCQSVTVISVGTAEASRFLLSAHPNPSSGAFDVQCDQSLTGYITDVTGKSRLLVNLDSGNNRLDLSHMANGIYFLHVTDGLSSSTLKLIKVGD